ncbi:transcriptional regulator [Pandoraea iniqua]|uniref:Transcriptional regulator n=1 Tax=Pandoraea iniqua TaxID=2508288 RepID=A0A5E4S7S0_9BURK|nr:helix-turn-helix domain-containing protein [Pandoraea iniqua]VVD66920.1 transcriptional regulator [Pandoraea iniqua]VVD70604.1 transcriptional regulator [Pandoraea iniqua]
MTEPRLVAFLIVPPFVLLDLAGPLDAFHAVIRNVTELGQPAPYRTVVVSAHGGPVETGSGITLHTEPMHSLASMDVDTLIAVGGAVMHRPAVPDVVGDWLRDYAPRVRRVCSVCVGAFILGAAGLLDGRRATTHWLDTAMLQTCYPKARVESDPIYVREDPVWTSAGITAGIDLGLALVEDDLGVDVALQAARRLVVFLKRAGGQSQFSPPLQEQFAAGAPFGELHGWMADRLDGDLSVMRLAEQANMSPRTFARSYLAKTGTTPAKAVERMRLEAARFALLDSEAPLKRIASRVGFGDEQNLRRAFVRQYGVTPAAYRERFGVETSL